MTESDIAASSNQSIYDISLLQIKYFAFAPPGFYWRGKS